MGWVPRSVSCTCSGICCWLASVMIVSGAMQLARTPWGPVCAATSLEFDAGLSGGVGDRGPWVWAARSRRRHGDDVPASTLFHSRQEALDRQERGGQVGVDGCAPGLLADLLDRAWSAWAATGVRDQDVNRAVDLFDSISHPFDLVVTREIGDGGHDPCACRLDLGADGLNGVGVAAVHDDARPFVCEERRDRRADAS